MAEQRDAEPEPATEHRARTTTAAVLWTTGALLIPGLAHLRAGRRWAGGIILTVFLLTVGSALVLLPQVGDDLARSAGMAVQTRWLLIAGGVMFGIAVLWMAVLVHSYVVLRPRRAHWAARGAAVVVVALLCLVVAAPAGAVMHVAYTTHQALSNVFEDDAPDAEPHDDDNPWQGEDRITVALFGSDGADSRYGTRTDSMMVANIDVEHGDIVLMGLPRNMQNVPFPPNTELAERYPEPAGFTDGLLNDIYQFVADEPEELAINRYARDPAADTLKETIGYALGLEIDFYAMVDMSGFKDLVDAVGGVTVRIEEDLPYGLEGDVLEAGVRRLDGNEALWYGRTRVNSDDYARMGRQGCLLKALADQVDPWTVLTSFQELAGATERSVQTDVPRSKLRHLIDVADLVPTGSMSTLQLSPPQVNPAYPDWDEIREMVDIAVQEQEDAQAGLASPSPSPSPSPSASPTPVEQAAEPGTDGDIAGQVAGETGDELTDWQQWSGSPEPTPTTPGRQVGEEPVSLESLCP